MKHKVWKRPNLPDDCSYLSVTILPSYYILACMTYGQIIVDHLFFSSDLGPYITCRVWIRLCLLFYIGFTRILTHALFALILFPRYHCFMQMLMRKWYGLISWTTNKSENIFETKVSLLLTNVLFKRVAWNRVPCVFTQLVRCQTVQNQIHVKSHQTSHKTQHYKAE